MDLKGAEQGCSEKLSLADRFANCLAAPYTDVENGGSYTLRRREGTLCVYFQWSHGKEDWKNNFDFPTVPYRDMGVSWRCHRGFLRVWKSIEPYVSPQILDPSVNRIEIIGYSHGAALALLCYEYCVYHRADAEVRGVGFGCPRVFWGVCPSEVKARFRNFLVVRNGCDLVTHVPPLMFGYRHISPILRIGEIRGPIRDHTPECYREGLTKIRFRGKSLPASWTEFRKD